MGKQMEFTPSWFKVVYFWVGPTGFDTGQHCKVREERDLGVSAHGQSGNTGTSGSDESIRDDCLH